MNGNKKTFFLTATLAVLLFAIPTLGANTYSLYGQNFTEMFYDDFSTYSTAYTSNGWSGIQQTGTPCNTPPNPSNFSLIGDTNGFNQGFGSYLGATTPCQTNLGKNSIYSNTTNNRIILNFTAIVSSRNENSSNTYGVAFSNTYLSSTWGLSFEIKQDDLSMRVVMNKGTANTCWIKDALIHNVSSFFTIDWDRTNSVVTVYKNNQATNCSLWPVNSDVNSAVQRGITLIETQAAGTLIRMKGISKVRVLQLTSVAGSTTSSYPVLYPCTNNTQCDTGYCNGGICEYLPTYYDCTTNSQCLSGSCVNGKCTNAGMWNSVSYTFDKMAGNSPDDHNFISLIIMIIVAIAATIGGTSIHQTGIGAIVGVMLFFMVGFFFASVGWLSAWIIFGMVFLIIVSIVLLIFVKSTHITG